MDNPNEQTPQLAPEEHATAQRFNMTDEQYAANRVQHAPDHLLPAIERVIAEQFNMPYEQYLLWKGQRS